MGEWSDGFDQVMRDRDRFSNHSPVAVVRRLVPRVAGCILRSSPGMQGQQLRQRGRQQQQRRTKVMRMMGMFRMSI